MTETKFKPGDRVKKVGGSYQATGTIKAAFLADDGSSRYVFRFDVPAGMLHIMGDANLEAEELSEILVCPKCTAPGGADDARGEFKCQLCGSVFQVRGGKILIP
jgi:rubredoxin